jgi:hypothetical protein
MENVEKYEFSLYELQKIRNALGVMVEVTRKEANQTGDHDYELIKKQVEKYIAEWGTTSGKQFRIM